MEFTKLQKKDAKEEVITRPPAPPAADQAWEKVSTPGKQDDMARLRTDSLGRGKGSPLLRKDGTPKLSIRTSPPMTVISDESQTPVGEDTHDNVSVIDLTWDDTAAKSVKREASMKRKRIDLGSMAFLSFMEEEDSTEKGSPTDKLKHKLRNLIRGIDKEARKLAKLVTDNPNTKREIKEVSAAMRSMTSQMTTDEMIAVMSGHSFTLQMGSEVNDAETQTVVTAARMTERATQTKQSRMAEPADGKVRREYIAKVKDYEDFARIKGLAWAEEVFSSTSHEDAPITQAGKDNDLIVWDEGEVAAQQSKKIMDKYLELRELAGDKAYLHLCTKSEDADGNCRSREQTISKIRTDGTERDCFVKLTEARDRMLDRERTKIAVYPPVGDDNGELFRKMTESIFAGTEIKCSVHYQHKRRETQKKDTDAIIISQEGKTYTELLKTVKQGIKEEDSKLTDNINEIRQTRAGEMLITLRHDGEKTQEMRNIITKIGDIQTKVRIKNLGRRVALHLKGMDAITTREEIAAAVIEETGVDRDSIRVGETKP